MKIDLNTITKYGFFVLLVVIVLILTLDSGADKNKPYVDALEKKIEQLEDTNKRIMNAFDSVSFALVQMSDSAALLREDNARLDNINKSTVRYYEKKIRNRDRLTTHELDSIFANRYGLSSGPAEASSH